MWTSSATPPAPHGLGLFYNLFSMKDGECKVWVMPDITHISLIFSLRYYSMIVFIGSGPQPVTKNCT